MALDAHQTTARQRLASRAIDLTHLSPYADKLKTRMITTKVVVHRISAGPFGVRYPARTAEECVRFFTDTAEGVATVALRGSYSQKLPVINQWQLSGIPDEKKSRAHCAYHAIIDNVGQLHVTIPMNAVGSHAPGANGDGIGLALLGDFRSWGHLGTWERSLGKGRDHVTDEQQKTLREVLRDLQLLYPAAQVLTHDEVRAERNEGPKHCPGDLAEGPVKAARHWAGIATGNVRDR